MDELFLKNKKKLCYIIAIVGLCSFINMLIAIVLTILNASSGLEDKASLPSLIIGIAGTLIASIPVIILVISALKIKPEKFNIYTTLLCISSGLGLTGFILLFITKINETNVRSLISCILMFALYIILTKAIKKQKNGKNGYTKAFVISEFIIIGLNIIATLVLTDYHLAAEKIITSLLALLFTSILEIYLVLVVKYIEDKKETIDQQVSLQAEETD